MRLRHCAVTLVVALAAAGCSGGSSGSGGSAHTAGSAPASGSATAPADPAAAKAQITANWETFFAYSTPRARAVHLVQGGTGLFAALAVAAQLQQQNHIRQGAKVTGVVFSSPTQATVSYQLLNGTTVLLPSATGSAVLVNGVWLVSKATFCALVQLGSNGKTVPGC
jgi:hypothetical protein